MEERICDAARQLFAERGYHGTATREIARVADVSETLLFRYYGNKAALFDAVVCAPFSNAIRGLLEDWEQLSDADLARERQHHIVGSIYGLFEENKALFSALLSARGTDSEEMGPLPFDGFLAFYKEGTRQQLASYPDRVQQADIDVGLGVRLIFGMLAASVLFNDWLFPDGRPPRTDILRALEHIVGRAIAPAPDAGDPD